MLKPVNNSFASTNAVVEILLKMFFIFVKHFRINKVESDLDDATSWRL